jgi:hypothetical protein
MKLLVSRVPKAPLENMSYMSAKITETQLNVSDGVDLTGDTKPSSIVSGKRNDTGEQEDNQFGYTSRLRSHNTQHRTVKLMLAPSR